MQAGLGSWGSPHRPPGLWEITAFSSLNAESVSLVRYQVHAPYPRPEVQAVLTRLFFWKRRLTRCWEAALPPGVDAAGT